MVSEETRLKEVFDNYYNGLSNTNIKEPINNNTILDLFNDFILTSQIVNSMIANGKEDIPNLTILDAGCGNGRMLRKMCELGAGPPNCCGIDLSRDVIDFAELNSPSRIVYDIGDIKTTPYSDNKFDVIFSLGVLIHIKDNDYIREIAKEFYRVLKPGGLIFITVARDGTQWPEAIKDITRNFSENELLGLFNGFECLGIYDAYSDNYIMKEGGKVSLSQIMRAIEVGVIDTTYKLVVFRKGGE